MSDPLDKVAELFGLTEKPKKSRRTKKPSNLLREQEKPEVLGYELERNTLTPKRQAINLSRAGDYGADPLGNGLFKMVPSGDVVDHAERNRRLKR